MAECDVRCAVPKRGALLAKDRSSVAALRRMLVLIPPLSYADGAWKKLFLVFPALDPTGYSNSVPLTAQTTFSTGNKQLQKCVLLGPGKELI
ncbi:transmembrane protein 267 isoform X2 [Gallus gallus]|uniref:transmembrane protein 267 isoform X2 n=1 Tax=Gallus gallus TaxID=9031 RepID=UPI001AE1E4F1|nr:transmembrane protein 267 isoform X2 [Gallus gallus]XP_046792335.1 transmembrane protein 267 isoform X2 [Gallus gallus]